MGHIFSRISLQFPLSCLGTFFCMWLCLPGLCELGREQLHASYSMIFYGPPMINFFGSSSRVSLMGEVQYIFRIKNVHSSVFNSKEIH